MTYIQSDQNMPGCKPKYLKLKLFPFSFQGGQAQVKSKAPIIIWELTIQSMTLSITILKAIDSKQQLPSDYLKWAHVKPHLVNCNEFPSHSTHAPKSPKMKINDSNLITAGILASNMILQGGWPEVHTAIDGSRRRWIYCAGREWCWCPESLLSRQYDVWWILYVPTIWYL